MPSGATDRFKTVREVECLWGLRIPVRDGVMLNATLYKPQAMAEPLPVLFIVTPYTADTYHDRALYFAEHEYVVALVDCRGRGNSEGQFVPHANDGLDGFDIVQWLANQPWSNGRIGMFGGSYEGYVQWATAKQRPPQLSTITPAASGCPGVDWPFHNNILHAYIMQWLTLTSGVTTNRNLGGDRSIWLSVYRRLLMEHLPMKSLDQLAGNLSTAYQDIISHHTHDDFWESMLPSSEQYRQVDIPVLSITGQYDINQRGAMHFYRNHVENATPSARSRHYLIVGPWDHKGTGTPSRKVGGLEFGEESLLDLKRLHVEWYDWVLKGYEQPDFLKRRVAYYLTGADRWEYADDLDGIARATRVYQLSALPVSSDGIDSGAMHEGKPTCSSPDSYTHDPLDTRIAELDLEQVDDYLVDQRQVLSLNGNGLLYQTEPFIEELVITGYLRYVASIALDVPDTDFKVTIYEITEAGVSIQLTDDMVRARYRNSLKAPEAVKPGEINRYEFKSFRFISRRLALGSRLRLVLSPVNSIYWERNYNSGGVVAEESAKNARVAHITLYHDAEHQSWLELPISA